MVNGDGVLNRLWLGHCTVPFRRIEGGFHERGNAAESEVPVDEFVLKYQKPM